MVYDIIGKIKELAALGERGAVDFSEKFDSAIFNGNHKHMLNIERSILETANGIQILNPHEYEALKRLRDDRHLCAHPAFEEEGDIYQPSPEIVRAHIVHSLQYLLIQAPLQGKSAINRFEADLLSPSFPVEHNEIRSFVKGKYLDRAKDAMVSNLIKAVISAPFGSERDKYVSKITTLSIVLHEISKVKASTYDDTLPSYVERKFEHVEDKVLLAICPFLKADPRIWGWLKEADRIRVRRLLEESDTEALKVNAVFDAFGIDELVGILISRFDQFDNTSAISVIRDQPCAEFTGKAIEMYSNAGSYRHAEALGTSAILPLVEFYSAEDVIKIIEAAQNNSQISDASGTSDILVALFDQTIGILPDTRAHWEEFVKIQTGKNGGDKGYHYSYPNIRKRLTTTPKE